MPTGDPPPPDGRLPPSVREAARGVPFGIYVHVPFCLTRCGYCDFNTYTATELGAGVSRGSYIDTVLLELRLARHVLRDVAPLASTVFFGGGTPTILPAEHLGLIVREIKDLFGLVPDIEITTEANPDSVTPAYFDKLRAAGFTRVSIGMQSAIPHVLAVLDRTHRPGRPEQAVAEAHAAGFDHVNLDLIYGAPHETDADWQASLDAAIGAGPDHISAYALVVEEGTALARQVAAGACRRPMTTCWLIGTYRPTKRCGARVSSGTRCPTGPAPPPLGRGTTCCTGERRTGGASAQARIATCPACDGGTSNTPRATARCSRPGAVQPLVARRSMNARA